MKVLKAKCKFLSENFHFQTFILFLIFLNALIFGIETYDISDKTSSTLHIIERSIVIIFIIELTIRILADEFDFFKDNWNIFDFVVIIVSIAPANSQFGIFRVLRVMRTLRLITKFHEMQRMVEAMFRSINGVFAITWLLFILTYIFAILATMFFGSSSSGEFYFGNLGKSLFSLFQVMTLESWSDGIARDIIEEHGWWAAVFFVVYIISTSFTFLNMFIAVFTNTMAAIDIDDGDDIGFSKILNEIKEDINLLKKEIQETSITTREKHIDLLSEEE